MRRTLTAIMLTALACGALLAGAALALDAWHWQRYLEAQSLLSSAAAADAVVVADPYQLHEESLGTYISGFLACCAATTFWTVFVVIPSLLAFRRLFTSAVVGHLVAAAVVCTVSGIAFAFVYGVSSYVSPLITFGVGGVVGLLGTVLVARLLPPNNSFERTREG